MKTNPDIFFIHRISQDDEEHLDFELATVLHGELVQSIDPEPDTIFTVTADIANHEHLREGRFVYNNGNILRAAGQDPRAKQAVMVNNRLRHLISTRLVGARPIAPLRNVRSYHVNVGHGNCSIIVFESDSSGSHEAIMVDCSRVEKIRGSIQDYTANLQACISYIRNRYNWPDFTVSRLIITHPHDDHFNGVEYLLQRGILRGAEIWANWYYSWAYHEWSQLLHNLYAVAPSENISFIEPLAGLTQGGIRIVHPDVRILRTRPRCPHYSQRHRVVVNANNASCIVQVSCGEFSMVLPGDIEQAGWSHVINCDTFLPTCTYYCVSHHASRTGHRKVNCPQSGGATHLSNCCSNATYAIVLGRDGAYSGIYSQQVLSDFGARIQSLDLGPGGNTRQFMELEWNSGRVTFY